MSMPVYRHHQLTAVSKFKVKETTYYLHVVCTVKYVFEVMTIDDPWQYFYNFSTFKFDAVKMPPSEDT